jgi:hypothetical protein
MLDEEGDNGPVAALENKACEFGMMGLKVSKTRVNEMTASSYIPCSILQTPSLLNTTARNMVDDAGEGSCGCER